MKNSLSYLSLAACLLSLHCLSNATDTSTMVDDLTPVLFPKLNKMANAIFSPLVLGYQTTVQVHHWLIVAVAFREPYAACEPIRLSFFGTKDEIDPGLCKPVPKAMAAALLFYYASMDFYPEATEAVLVELVRLGVPPDPTSVDRSTPNGYAIDAASRLINFFANDGWNAFGLEGLKEPFFPHPYGDTTGYMPKNFAGTTPEKLNYPLHWQPRTLTQDGFGSYISENFITPHVGERALPLSMGCDEWEELWTPDVYECANEYRRMCGKDISNLKHKYIPQMLRAMRKMATDRIRTFTTFWWDDKFISAGVFRPAFESKKGLNAQEMLFSGLGELIAFHDSVLIAWREKRRHDLARPESVMKRLWRGKSIRSWRGHNYAAGPIPVEEWEPTIRTVPHPEYPSGSSTICTAVLDFLYWRMKYEFGDKWEPPVLNISLPHRRFPWVPVDGKIDLTYHTLEQAKKECGDSRISAGLNFEPAIIAGDMLGQAVGRASFETWRDLEEGRVPKHCHWCTNKKQKHSYH